MKWNHANVTRNVSQTPMHPQHMFGHNIHNLLHRIQKYKEPYFAKAGRSLPFFIIIYTLSSCENLS